MTLKAGVHLVRIASTVAVQTSAADDALLTLLIVHETCTTVFTNQTGIFFDMAVIAEMVCAFRACAAAGIITLAAIPTQFFIYTTLPATDAMDLLLFCTVHTHFTSFAELRVVGAFITDLTMMLIVAISAAVGTAVVAAGADPVIAGTFSAELTLHIDIPRMGVKRCHREHSDHHHKDQQNTESFFDSAHIVLLLYRLNGRGRRGSPLPVGESTQNSIWDRAG